MGLALFGAACGGSTAEDADAGADAAADVGPEPADATPEAATDAPHDVAADAPPEAATDAVAACEETNDRATTWWVDGGTTTGCPGDVKWDGGPGPSFEIDAEVVAATDDTLTLNLCNPLTACLHQAELHVQAPGLVLSDAVPLHAYVHVNLSFDGFWGCHSTLLVRSVPSWAGAPNPAGTGDALLVAAIDGGTATPGGAPYEATPVGLGCNVEASGGCGGAMPVDDYVWRFVEQGDTFWTDVAMGETRALPLGGHGYHARNLRSYQSTLCDDYWNWAYWIARDP
jgi:hypothetical protein